MSSVVKGGFKYIPFIFPILAHPPSLTNMEDTSLDRSDEPNVFHLETISCNEQMITFTV